MRIETQNAFVLALASLKPSSDTEEEGKGVGAFPDSEIISGLEIVEEAVLKNVASVEVVHEVNVSGTFTVSFDDPTFAVFNDEEFFRVTKGGIRFVEGNGILIAMRQSRGGLAREVMKGVITEMSGDENGFTISGKVVPRDLFTFETKETGDIRTTKVIVDMLSQMEDGPQFLVIKDENEVVDFDSIRQVSEVDLMATVYELARDLGFVVLTLPGNKIIVTPFLIVSKPQRWLNYKCFGVGNNISRFDWNISSDAREFILTDINLEGGIDVFSTIGSTRDEYNRLAPTGFLFDDPKMGFTPGDVRAGETGFFDAIEVNVDMPLALDILPGMTVGIRGLGRRFSGGRYYVERVGHKIDGGGASTVVRLISPMLVGHSWLLIPTLEFIAAEREEMFRFPEVWPAEEGSTLTLKEAEEILSGKWKLEEAY